MLFLDAGRDQTCFQSYGRFSTVADKICFISQEADRAAFEALRKLTWVNSEKHPLRGEFGRRYYPLVFDSRWCDKSFALFLGNRPCAIVDCNISGGELSYFGMPAKVELRDELEDRTSERIISRCLDHLEHSAREAGTAKIRIADQHIGLTLSSIGRACLNRRAVGHLRVVGHADIAGGGAEFHRRLRKSYRSLVNWGRRNLRIEYVNRANPSQTIFGEYQELHKAVAGRETRSQDSWDAMREWVTAGHGELAAAYLDGRFVSGVVLIDGLGLSVYASGASDRSLWDKPLGHWPLYASILRCGERKLGSCELGDIPQRGAASEKEISIGYFKRGFATRLSTSLVWELDLESE